MSHLNSPAPDLAGYIHTYTGKRFWPLAPVVEDIDIIDIAHSLSQQCRFTGHSRDFYSVAEHSIHVMQEVWMATGDAEWALCALLHDAPEAYLHDIASPVKYGAGFELYRKAEDDLLSDVCSRFGLTSPDEWPAFIKMADIRVLHTEARDLMNDQPSWANEFHMISDVDLSSPLSAKVAERAFLDHFEVLNCITSY